MSIIEVMDDSRMNSLETKSHDLERQMAVLEERMETKQYEYKTDIAQLDRHLRAELSDLKTEAAKRETRLLLALVALISVAVTIILHFA